MKNRDKILDGLIATFRDEMVRSNVEINMSSDEISYPGSPGLHVHGYFVDLKGPKFGISTEDKEWRITFIHEYCHFLQWKEKDKNWTQSVFDPDPEYGHGFHDVLALLEAWSKNDHALSGPELQDMCERSLNLELDCERRVVEILRQNKIHPRYITEYIQRSNSYIISYMLIPIFGNEYQNAPYEVEDLWRKMPKTFDVDYKTVWHDFVSLYWRHCYKPEEQCLVKMT